MLTQSERASTFQFWLFNWAGQSTDETDIRATGDSLDAYIEAHGWPRRVVVKDSVRVAEYVSQLVGEVEGEAFVYRTGSGS